MLRERGRSLRAFAAEVGVSQGHLSRALRGADYRSVSGELAGRIAVTLELPRDYFPEYRQAIVIEAVRSDPALRDRLYGRLTTG
ncbi:MAG TPA: helix-turn-helix transcriptional regulator [Vicinamibacterales bacterium]|nr:helix-turn-helix transcriptional regulator [Vicinamibacterales bacterium]